MGHYASQYEAEERREAEAEKRRLSDLRKAPLVKVPVDLKYLLGNEISPFVLHELRKFLGIK